MTPVCQTKHSPPDGNCFAACVASLLDKPIEEVDIDVASCGESYHLLRTRIEEKAKCKIYKVNREALLDGVLRTSEKFCFAAVCTSLFNKDPNHPMSLWHAVVCEILEGGDIKMVWNPDKKDQRQESLEQFPAVAELFFVKPR